MLFKSTVRYGIYGFVGIALFFLLMKLFGLEDVAALRGFNIVIVVYLTNRLARRSIGLHPGIEYFQALSSLFLANALTVALSALGFYFYATVIDPAFLSRFDEGFIWLGKINVFKASTALFMEGIASSIIISFATMQWWKDTKSINPASVGKW